MLDAAINHAAHHFAVGVPWQFAMGDGITYRAYQKGGVAHMQFMQCRVEIFGTCTYLVQHKP